MKPMSEGSENQSHESEAEERGKQQFKTQRTDTGKDKVGSLPEYANCIKKKGETEKALQVGVDVYEKASGFAHEYFILEPDNAKADNKTSFQVIEDTGDKPDDTVDDENLYHQYFTLEKLIHN